MNPVTTPMLQERKAIEEFLKTQVKDPFQCKMVAIQIHNWVGKWHTKKCASVNDTIARVDVELQTRPVRVSTGDGVLRYNLRSKYLTERQRNTVLEYLRSILAFGGKFSVVKEEE